MYKSCLIFPLLFLLFTSCSPFAKVYSEEEPGINLSRYHLYRWAEDDAGYKGPQTLSAALQAKIRAALETELALKGLQEDTARAELLLHYHVVLKNEILYVQDLACMVRGDNHYGICKPVRPVQYKEGTLILDMIDPTTKNQVWRGAAVSVLENLSVEAADARIKAAAKAIVKKYPGRQRTP